MQNWHWQSLLVSSSNKLRNALEVLNQSGSNFLLIVDDSNTLLGTLTDGDVRRSLLDGKTLESSVTHSMNTNFIHCLETDSPSDVASILIKHSISYGWRIRFTLKTING